MTRRRGAALRFGCLCAAAGLLVGTLATRGATGAGWGQLPFAALLAALLTGAGAWWLLVARRPAPVPRWRGVLAGALTGLVGHYACWYLLLLLVHLCVALGRGAACLGGLGERPLGPLDALWGAAVYALLSLLQVGWLTLPLGALLGWVFATRQGLGRARASSAA